jgi:hypothetical protein
MDSPMQKDKPKKDLDKISDKGQLESSLSPRVLS